MNAYKKLLLIGMAMLLTGAMHVTAQSELYPQHFDLSEVTLLDGGTGDTNRRAFPYCFDY